MKRPDWSAHPDARALVMSAVASDPQRLTPARVRLVVETVRLAEARGARRWCCPGPDAAMARELAADGYLAAEGAPPPPAGLWASPGPRAEALVAPFRRLPGFGAGALQQPEAPVKTNPTPPGARA